MFPLRPTYPNFIGFKCNPSSAGKNRLKSHSITSLFPNPYSNGGSHVDLATIELTEGILTALFALSHLHDKVILSGYILGYYIERAALP